jgi:hypothetical protein
MYSIFHKIPNASVTIFIFKKYFGILCLILKHELCKVIHSTHYVKFWKLKKIINIKLSYLKKIVFGFFLKILYVVCGW